MGVNVSRIPSLGQNQGPVRHNQTSEDRGITMFASDVQVHNFIQTKGYTYEIFTPISNYTDMVISRLLGSYW